MMRGTPRMRLVFALLSPIFFLLCVIAIHSEETRPWADYQEKFAALFAARARVKLEEVKAEGDARKIGRWQRVIDEVTHWRPEVKQVYIEDAKVADRCQTCHLGVDNPLFADAPQPFRTHPGKLLRSHEVNRFGCTLCHDGQGLATDLEAAHGNEENWPRPLLPRGVLQSA